MLKYTLLPVILLLLLLACGNKQVETNGLILANQVCECKMKTKSMKYADPERKRIWSECLDLQGANFKKLGSNKTENEVFTKRVKECLLEITVGK